MPLPPYNRSAHQPAASPRPRAALTPAQLVQACGRTTCLVLAHREGTAPLRVEFDDPDTPPVTCGEDGKTPRPLQVFEGMTCVQRAVRCAQAAQLAGVTVLAPEQEEPRKRVEAAVRAADAEGTADKAHTHTSHVASKESAACDVCEVDATSKAGSVLAASEKEDSSDTASARPPRVVAWDACLNRALSRNAGGLDLLSLAPGVLECAWDALTRHAEADSVLIMACDQVRITPAHLAEVCGAFRDDPDLDVVSSWIAWLDRTPVLISSRYLEKLHRAYRAVPANDDSSAHAHQPNRAYRPLPADFNAKQIVFGEEKLAANDPGTPAVERFLKDCTLSAREAVALARAEREKDALKSRCGNDGPHEADGPHGADDSQKDTKPAAERSKADCALIAAAQRVLDRLGESLAPDEERAVAQADAWGRRNRSDFPLLNDAKHARTLAYLDSAATTQRCFRALHAQQNFDEHENANVYRGSYPLSMQATLSLNAARKTLEDFIGADRRQTVYTANASASCALVAQAWGEHNIEAGDVLAVPSSEHHSDLLPWLMLAQRKHAEVAFIPLLPDGRLDEDAFGEILLRRPKLVAMAHIGNVMGLENPVKRMAKKAHGAGARVYVDAAQSLAHVPLNVKDLGADFVGFSAHKMYGPLGIGGLWISPDAFAEMDPLVAGGGTISHVSLDSYYLRAGAIQYELGTPPISQAIGWAGAIDYLCDLGMENVAKHAAVLTRYLMLGLEDAEGVSVWGNHVADHAAGQMGLVAFSCAGIPPATVGAFCGKLGVAVRSGGHCALPLASRMGVIGTVRASLAVHTTREDVEALLTAVEMCRQLHEDGFENTGSEKSADSDARAEDAEEGAAESAKRTSDYVRGARL